MAAYLTECPYCGRIVGNNRHLAICPKNPAIRTEVGVLLADENNPGHALSMREYSRQRTARHLHHLPSYDALIDGYGSWENVCAEFGLLSVRVSVRERIPRPKPPLRKNTERPCVHCGRMYVTTALNMHERNCPHQPGIKERVRALVESDHPGVAITVGQYHRRADRHNETHPKAERVPALNTLQQNVGTWTEIVHWLGLKTETDAVDEIAAVDVQTEAAIVAWEISEIEREKAGAFGFVFCGEPRVVRGLRTADGRECVAMMIR